MTSQLMAPAMATSERRPRPPAGSLPFPAIPLPCSEQTLLLKPPNRTMWPDAGFYYYFSWFSVFIKRKDPWGQAQTHSLPPCFSLGNRIPPHDAKAGNAGHPRVGALARPWPVLTGLFLCLLQVCPREVCAPRRSFLQLPVPGWVLGGPVQPGRGACRPVRGPAVPARPLPGLGHRGGTLRV